MGFVNTVPIMLCIMLLCDPRWRILSGMKSWSTYRNLFFALTTVLAGISQWTCAMACESKADTNLACVRACARYEAFLTQHGKVPSVGSKACGVSVKSAHSWAPVPARFSLAAPASNLADVVVPTTCAMATEMHWTRDTRGPPPHPFLWSQHPFAQAPPTLL